MKNIITTAMIAMTVILSGCGIIDDAVEDKIGDELTDKESLGVAVEKIGGNQKARLIAKSEIFGRYEMRFCDYDENEIDLTTNLVAIYVTGKADERQPKYLVHLYDANGNLLESIVGVDIAFYGNCISVNTRTSFTFWGGEFEVTELQIAK